jgi:hypothetical protein
VDLIFAVTGLHNFIRQHSPRSEFSEWEETEVEKDARLNEEMKKLKEERIRRRGLGEDVPDMEYVEGEDQDMAALRETIAHRMWNDYVQHRSQR